MNQPAIRLPDAIVTLSDEHRYMNLLLETLDEQLRELDPKVAKDYYLMQDIVRYMHEYPDAVHHPTEDIMFSKLLNRDPAAKSEIDRLQREHELLTENTAELLELLDSAASKQTAEATEAVRAAAANYISRLRGHMQHEESVVFPRAIQCLAGKDWHAIEARLEATDDPLFGAHVGREYRVLYEYFADRAENMSQQLTRYGFLQLDSMIIGADAIETGIEEFWGMLQGHTESLSKECRSTLDRTFDGRGAVSAIGTQLQFFAFLGKKFVNIGGDTLSIYFRTLKQVAKPFLSTDAETGNRRGPEAS